MNDISIAHSLLEYSKFYIYSPYILSNLGPISAFAAGTVSGLTANYLNDYIKKRNGRNERDKAAIKDLWHYYLSPLIDYDCQNLLGTMGGGPAKNTYEAAKSEIIPFFYKNITSHLKRDISIEPTSDYSVKNNMNIIAYGGITLSDICKDIMLNDEMRFVKGFIYTDDKKYSGGDEFTLEKYPELASLKKIASNNIYIKKYIEQKDVISLRNERFLKRAISPSGSQFCNFIIVDAKEDKIVSWATKSPRDGTYTSDSAIITFFESPLNKHRDALLISGTGDMGTYLGNLILKEPQYIKLICNELAKSRVRNNDRFQIVTEFDIYKYRLNEIAPRKILKNFRVVGIHKF